MALQILFEDNHLIAVNKKAGDIVQGDKTGDRTLADEVKDYIKKKYKKPGDVFLGIVHRLDRPTSGVVIFARTSKALARLNAMLQERSIQKTYWAITGKRPPAEEGTLQHYLRKNEEKNKSNAHDAPVKGSQKAILHYKLVATTDNYNLVQVVLETGRHHQIRAQLAKVGCPIKGDLKYGFARSNSDGSISLHARSLKFEHPVKKEPVTIIAPVPDEVLWKIFEDSVS